MEVVVRNIKENRTYRHFPVAVQVYTRFLDGRAEVCVVANGHGYAFDPEFYEVIVVPAKEN